MKTRQQHIEALASMMARSLRQLSRHNRQLQDISNDVQQLQYLTTLINYSK